MENGKLLWFNRGMEYAYKIRGTKVGSPYPAQLTPAECRLVFSLQRIFRPENILADVYLPKLERSKAGGRTSQTVVEADLLQIDCLAVNQAGVFVFESKDYAGWIYGHGERLNWMQVLNYGQEKHQFYNPVKQNEAHVKAVYELLGEKARIFSVIVFGREATLKVVEDLPEGCRVCTQGGVKAVTTELGGEAQRLNEGQIVEIVRIIRAGQVNPTTGVRDAHIEEVKRVQKKE